MAGVRLLGMGRVKDHEAAVDVLNRVSNVAAQVDGAVVWEAFVDEATGLVVLNEGFTSEKALMEYEDAVTSNGLRSAVAEAMEMEQLILLSRIEDKRLNEVFDAMGAIRVTPVASR